MPTHSGRQSSTKADLSSPRSLVVTYKTVGSLKPDPRNARTHSKQQVEQIIASIREFGFTNPILVDPEGMLIAGHGRLLAAKAMGMAEVPTIELVGLTEAQKRALRLADNKIALGAGWDLDLLKVELAELSTLDLDMDLTVTGFSTGELDVLLSGSEDVADAIQDVTRRGELVLDTFLGSGTTLIASERCGRRFRGLELDPAFVGVEIERWTTMTGGTPERIEGRTA